MKKIALISTGGTIAMQADNSGLAVPTAGAKDLIESLSDIRKEFIVDDFDFINIPSAHMTIEDLIGLRKLVIDVSKKGYDGIVITHGTDTMEETAYFLDLTTDLDIPIILTGSQRNLSAISSDVAINIIDSIRVAADEMAAKMGVLIVFASEIIPAREATKTHRTRLDTFKSLEFGHIGTIDNKRVLWFRMPIIRETYGLGNIENIVVDIIPSYLGADSRNIRNSIKDSVDGIVFQALGAGHIPKAMLDGIKEAISGSIPLVLTSRPIKGRFFTNTYGFEGSEKHLRSLGVIFGEDLPPQKVRIKLMVLLSLGYDYDRIKYEFEKNYYVN